MKVLPVLTLKTGREKSLLRRHPWIFSGAVKSVPGTVESGAPVLVRSADGVPLAVASYAPDSQIAARVWSFDPAVEIDRVFFNSRFSAAAELRRTLGLDAPDGGCRLVNAEGDGLPGITVDRYGCFLVLQLSSAGAEYFRNEIADALAALSGVSGIYERSDSPVRSKDGLAARNGLLRGTEPPNPLIIREGDLRFAIDVRHGQKSGFYFDQRDSRTVVRRIASGRRVLNTFCYTGAFAVAALAGGAEHVLNIDSSAPALALAAHNLEMNRFGVEKYENRCADVFSELRSLAEAGEKFDLIILDPPKFISSAHALPQGCRAYQDIARLGFSLLNPGGLLLNFSCSGLMTPELFGKVTAAAALEAGVDARIILRLSQATDHPVSLAVPEGLYLKGLLSEIA